VNPYARMRGEPRYADAQEDMVTHSRNRER